MISQSKRSYAIIGAASDVGGRSPGAAEGPQILRERGLLDALRATGADVVDKGDVDSASSLELWNAPAFHEKELETKNYEQVYHSCSQIYSGVHEINRSGRVPIILGGDHSISMGSVAAVSSFYRLNQERVGLIWIDTHSDINTPETSPSGNLHGMAVAALTGIMPGAFSLLGGKAPAILPENMVYVGLREVDPGEAHFIKQHDIRAFTMKDVDRVGIAQVIEKAIAVASENTSGFIVSFDLDVCDPAIAPGTGTTKRGGLTFRESHLAIELLHDSKKILAFELVELNPRLDLDSLTADLGISLLESAVGKSIL